MADMSQKEETVPPLQVFVRDAKDESSAVFILSPSTTKDGGRLLFTRSVFDAETQKWRKKEFYRIKEDDHDVKKRYQIILSRGGEVNIFPDLFSTRKTKKITKELLKKGSWRSYSIQGGAEPRLHCL